MRRGTHSKQDSTRNVGSYSTDKINRVSRRLECDHYPVGQRNQSETTSYYIMPQTVVERIGAIGLFLRSFGVPAIGAAQTPKSSKSEVWTLSLGGFPGPDSQFGAFGTVWTARHRGPSRGPAWRVAPFRPVTVSLQRSVWCQPPVLRPSRVLMRWRIISPKFSLHLP